MNLRGDEGGTGVLPSLPGGELRLGAVVEALHQTAEQQEKCPHDERHDDVEPDRDGFDVGVHLNPFVVGFIIRRVFYARQKKEIYVLSRLSLNSATKRVHIRQTWTLC